MNTKNLQLYAPAVLRIGISAVYLWFGIQQFLHTTEWVGFIPQFILNYSPVDAQTLIHFNGAIELVFGFTLLFGIFSRVSASVLALHMAHITFIVGYDAIGVRDFGITIATIAAACYGADILSLESYLTIRNPSFSNIDTTAVPTGHPSSSLGHVLTKDAAAGDAMVQYIQQEQLKGTPLHAIRDSLFLSGWTTAEIDAAYSVIAQKNSSGIKT